MLHTEMETSAIGDMAFLLLIFFIVTSSFLMRMGIFLSLPSDSGGAIKVEKKQLFEITPLGNGYLVDQNRVTGLEALELLRQKKESQNNLIYVVYMNPSLKYERLIDALSLAGKAGVQNISVKDKVKDK